MPQNAVCLTLRGNQHHTFGMKIYTRGGDTGETGIYGGERVRKDDLRIDAVGSVDELNAALGVAGTITPDAQIKEELLNVQNELFAAGWDLATPLSANVPRLTGQQTLRLESMIDLFEVELPALTNFILPGGSGDAAALHSARCVCRRAERAVVTLMSETEINSEIERYINRLSDYLFVIARVANHRLKVDEIIWKRS
jgi:cob(I)alamin adenosyltransferase